MIRLRAICFVVLAMLALRVYADPVLQTAGNFVVLGGAGHPGVTNSGPTTLTGQLGVSPDNVISGLGDITINGSNGLISPDVHLGGNRNALAGRLFYRVDV